MAGLVQVREAGARAAEAARACWRRAGRTSPPTPALARRQPLAAVTRHASPVQGGRKLALGSLPYGPPGRPGFARAWFPPGADAKALAKAPVLIFDRPAPLQGKWAPRNKGARLAAPMHWIP